MSESNSYRQILRSSSIIGGASVINILVGLLRMKVAAIVLGPAGVGLIGLLQSLMTTAAAVSAMGLGNVGTRQIAEAIAKKDQVALCTVRRAVFWGTVLLAVAGGIAFWVLRDVWAVHLFGDQTVSNDLAWIAVGVTLTVASGSQGALLNGMRRVGDMARVSIGAGLMSTAIGITALWGWGDRSIFVFVLAAPLASFFVGHWYVAKLPLIYKEPTPIRVIVGQWLPLIRLGAAFMVSGLVVTLGNLGIRALVQQELGADANGYFQAAWMISMTYVGYVLGAMGADFYPRLTAVMHDNAAVNRLVNQQSEVALLLAGPVLVAMIGLAPWVIELLYSNKFSDAASVLRWQVLGDVLKIVSWPLGYLILAAGDGRTFLVTETIASFVLIGLTWIGLPVIGIEATGVAFLAMYLVYLPVVYWLARRRTGFSWDRRVGVHFAMLLALTTFVFLAADWSKWLGACMGLFISIALGVFGFARLANRAKVGGWLGKLAKFGQEKRGKIGVRDE